MEKANCHSKELAFLLKNLKNKQTQTRNIQQIYLQNSKEKKKCNLFHFLPNCILPVPPSCSMTIGSSKGTFSHPLTHLSIHPSIQKIFINFLLGILLSNEAPLYHFLILNFIKDFSENEHPMLFQLCRCPAIDSAHKICLRNLTMVSSQQTYSP